jgi:probable phosphoglycerate mutase
MTIYLLVRHGMCDPLGTSIAGRAAGVHLNALGRSQAQRLVQRLTAVPLDAVYSSPLERAVETAEPIAQRRGLELRLLDALGEIDFGTWTGSTLAHLAGDADWHRFNTLRSITRIPNGELMLEVQARALGALEAIRREHPEGRCAVVSHGDVIRGTIAHFAGIPLDLMQRLEIAPASVSVLRVTEKEVAIHGINLSDEAP